MKLVLMQFIISKNNILFSNEVTGESEVILFFIYGSDFVEMYVGIITSCVHYVFQQAKNNLPCNIFIDEISAFIQNNGYISSCGSNGCKHKPIRYW